MDIGTVKKHCKGYTEAFGYYSCRKTDFDWLIKTVAQLTAENERIKAKNVDLEDALALAHTELTSIPDWPDTEHEHFVSETIEQALQGKKGSAK